MSVLLKDYKSWLSKIKRSPRARYLVCFHCPDCHKAIHTLKPMRGSTWDSMSACPYCDALFFKRVDSKGAVSIERPDAPVPPTVNVTLQGGAA